MPFERVPNPPVAGELLIELRGVVQCSTCGETPVPDKYYGSKCGCSPVLSEDTKRTLDEVERCRTAWEASDQIVPFPDYWLGWLAATLLINQRAELEASKLREATLAGQLNAALQPTIDGEAFKQLRKELDVNYRAKRRFKQALQKIADGEENAMTYAQLVLDGVL